MGKSRWKVVSEKEPLFWFPYPWSRAISIIEGGIDISYDKESMERLNTAIKSDEQLDYFLKYEYHMYDRETNMDW